VAAQLNVGLVTAGIHLAGVTGAAAGTALSSLGWNLWLYRLVRRHVGIYPSIVDAMLHRPVAA
jgi:O-antigen/teichoic acid export membrane protein